MFKFQLHPFFDLYFLAAPEAGLAAKPMLSLHCLFMCASLGSMILLVSRFAGAPEKGLVATLLFSLHGLFK